MTHRMPWSAVDDFAGARLADRRHHRRLTTIARRAMAAPRSSFPRMMRDDGELEGAYRLFSNRAVSPTTILDAHYEATAARVQASEGPAIVIHDTTECTFGGETDRDGIGRLSNDGKGLAVHVALVISRSGRPHGLLDVATNTRFTSARSKRQSRSRAPATKESARWGKTVARASARLGRDAANVVHVMDREADSFVLLEELDRTGRAFVIRSAHNRRLSDLDYDYLREAADDLGAVVVRDVPLSRRSDKNRRVSAKKRHPARLARTATLAVGARQVTVRCSKRTAKHVERKELTLTVVRIWEPDPPAGEAAIEWLLLTNLPVRSSPQLEAIVDIYRARWTIEEFFKALKTGCSFERRQLESRHALENALAVLAPIACRLLLLRSLAQTAASEPATIALSPIQLLVLRAISTRFKLPEEPTVRDALHAIAGLGGFLRRNGEPGWQTIGLGFDELLKAELAWNAAKRHGRSDQS
jgi:hypothetical protein